MLNHFVIIRFRYPLNDPLLPIRRKYLYDICLHSLSEQVNQNFKTVILSDEKDLKCDLLTTSKRGLPKVLPKTGFIITTRVDSDDVVLPNFIDNIQKEFHYQHRLIIDHCGYNYDVRNNRMTFHRPPETCPSQFLSLIERADRAIYCMHQAHSKMWLTAPVKTLEDPSRIFCIHSHSQDSSKRPPGFYNSGSDIDTKPYTYYINKLIELDGELNEALCSH